MLFQLMMKWFAFSESQASLDVLPLSEVIESMLMQFALDTL